MSNRRNSCTVATVGVLFGALVAACDRAPTSVDTSLPDPDEAVVPCPVTGGCLTEGELITLAPVLPDAVALNMSTQSTAWMIGDVFAGVANGTYRVFDNTGAFKESISDGLGGFTTGCAFNPTLDKLYTTNFSSSTIVVYDDASPHNIVQTIASGLSAAESVVFASNGHFYVGSPFSGGTIEEYDAAGILVDTDALATDGTGGTDWMDLASDQATMFVTAEGRNIYRFDVVADVQLANFATLPGGGNAFALRLLPPGDGSAGLLVADRFNVKRLDGAGATIQTYDAAGQDGWFALNLDPDGTSFWAGSFGTGNFYKFDIASGAVLTGPVFSGSASLFGLCLKGEPTAATGIEADIDIKFCSNPNGFNCKSKGKTPVTIFGTSSFDVTDIDISTLQLCEDGNPDNCTGPPLAWSVADRGDPTTDLGAAMCAIDPLTGEELDWLNQDGFDDLDVAFDTQELVGVIGCDALSKGDASLTLILVGETVDGIPITSTAIGDVGIDQLLIQNN